MAELQMQDYEEFRQKEDVTYDDIKFDKEKIETNKLVLTTRNQWLKYFLLILTISVFSASVASTVTYFTVCAQLKQFTLDLIKIKLDDVKKTNEIKVQEIENRFNLTSSSLQEQINDSTDRVGFTAFGRSHGTKSRGHILRFPDIKTSFGLSGLSTFISSGKFTCEKDGLYLVSFTVMSCSKGDSTYDFYKNNILLMPYYVTQDEVCGSGSGTIIIRLYANDTLYLETNRSDMMVYDSWSSFSILKIK